MTLPIVEPLRTTRTPASVRVLIQRLRDAGHLAYICGGAVRDLLLGREPHDWDLATDAPPDRVETLLAPVAQLVPIGRAFGVMLAVVGDAKHEIATFRSESGYADGRRPDLVRFSSPDEDARRRDFTINALFFDPVAEVVIDHVGGLADLRARRLRAVGDPAERFREDHLRLLRAVRFAARMDFAVADDTWRAVKELAPLAARVAAERQAVELEAMLTGGAARRSFALLDESELLAAVLPEVARMRGVPQPPAFHPEGDVWVHTLIMLGLFDAAVRGEREAAVVPEPPADAAFNPATGMIPADLDPAARAAVVGELYDAFDDEARRQLAWTVLLHDIGKPDTIAFADRIRFNNHDRVGSEQATALLERLKRPRALIGTVADIIGRHMHFATLRRMRTAKRRRWLMEPSFGLHWELHRLDCESSHRMLANWAWAGEQWRDEKKRPPLPEPLVGGRDLLAMGLAPGPAIGAWLARVEDARLEGWFGTREEALQWLRRELRVSR